MPPAISSLGPEALSDLLTGPASPLVLHVLPEDSWERERLPGSRCACVYEMSFLAKVEELAAGKSSAIVVYGAGRPSLDSAVAAEKLAMAGYSNVSDFGGGITAWQEAGKPLEGNGLPPDPPGIDGSWQVDPAESVIRWTGRNLFNHHEGTLRLSGGSLEIAGGSLSSAAFTVDLTTIACTDLVDPAMNRMLLRHLADPDFFDTGRFPEAGFTATKAVALPETTPGVPNFLIEGDFTVRGMTRAIRFPAVVAFNQEGRLTAQAQLEIDRTLWGINYGSGRLFAWLGPHVVNDHITLHLKIHAQLRV